jgi:hypothetical protein
VREINWIENANRWIFWSFNLHIKHILP